MNGSEQLLRLPWWGARRMWLLRDPWFLDKRTFSPAFSRSPGKRKEIPW
jgi:hypothetical protein